LVIETIDQLNQRALLKEVADVLLGNKSQTVLNFKYDKLPLFGEGREKDEHFWHSVIRQALLYNYLYKDIEDYGILKISDVGLKFLDNPEPFNISLNHNFVEELQDDEAMGATTSALDPTLYAILKDLRKRVAHKKNVPPFVVFQDPSIEEMATRYPLNIEEMKSITGVSEGKARRYGPEFIAAINAYVEENEIERPVDFVIKSVANKSKAKVSIIQNIDKKIPFQDIAESQGMRMDELIHELYMIIGSGTKLNIAYHIEDAVDEGVIDEIEDYFMNAETDDLDAAYKELKADDITIEEIELVRLKFLSDNAN
jgi:ATP-dependent DNA helicase RecQ